MTKTLTLLAFSTALALPQLAAAQDITGIDAGDIVGHPVSDALPSWPAMAERVPVADQSTRAVAVTAPLPGPTSADQIEEARS